MDISNEDAILNNIKIMRDCGYNWNAISRYYTKIMKEEYIRDHMYITYGLHGIMDDDDNMDSIYDTAACYGHLEILKFAHENGLQWSGDECACAAIYGNLDILYYLYENEAPYSIPWLGVDDKCKEFLDIYGDNWKHNEFLMGTYVKPAKNKP